MPEELFTQKSTRLPPLSQCFWRKTTEHDTAKPVLQGHHELSPLPHKPRISSVLLMQLKALLSENTHLKTATGA